MVIRVIFLSFFHLKFPFYFFKGDLIFFILLEYSWFTMFSFKCTAKWFSYVCVYICVHTHTHRHILGHELLRKVSIKSLLSKWICIPIWPMGICCMTQGTQEFLKMLFGAFSYIHIPWFFQDTIYLTGYICSRWSQTARVTSSALTSFMVMAEFPNLFLPHFIHP